MMNIFDAGVGERERADATTELCNTRQGMGLTLMGYTVNPFLVSK
jgi:hypothetical protein